MLNYFENLLFQKPIYNEREIMSDLHELLQNVTSIRILRLKNYTVVIETNDFNRRENGINIKGNEKDKIQYTIENGILYIEHINKISSMVEKSILSKFFSKFINGTSREDVRTTTISCNSITTSPEKFKISVGENKNIIKIFLPSNKKVHFQDKHNNFTFSVPITIAERAEYFQEKAISEKEKFIKKADDERGKAVTKKQKYLDKAGLEREKATMKNMQARQALSQGKKSKSESKKQTARECLNRAIQYENEAQNIYDEFMESAHEYEMKARQKYINLMKKADFYELLANG